MGRPPRGALPASARLRRTATLTGDIQKKSKVVTRRYRAQSAELDVDREMGASDSVNSKRQHSSRHRRRHAAGTHLDAPSPGEAAAHPDAWQSYGLTP